MPPVSSLIFVVILAVWAVYLVQHWIRRREHLATARSVDRFSESMRVLERRRTLQRPQIAPAPAPSYGASPLRPARPEVVVKRGTAHGATAVAPTRSYRRGRLVARLRAGALALAGLTMVTLVALGATGGLPSWTAFVGIAVLAGALVLVRVSVAGARSASVVRRTVARRPARRPAGRPAGRDGRLAPAGVELAADGTAYPSGRTLAAQAAAVSARPPAARQGSARRAVLQRSAPAPTHLEHLEPAPDTPSPVEPVHVVAALVEQQREPQLYDLVEVEASLAPPRPSEGAEVPAAAEGTWSPTPVPPPTYTLKAKAYRSGLAGSSSLPVDGTVMALDEEFEDLPSVDRVG
ncbi:MULTISPECIES: hypothetical protein [unclassified Ornithinimicrobium]|uniref:hypothetical protein n=1 Tax=unclassified Ornithinimicrobium TaxID=2615080 RepID=UPI0038518EBA